MNKRVAWISALTLAISVGLIGPALAIEAPAAVAAPEPVAAAAQTVTPHAPVVTTDDFAPKTVPVVEADKPAPVKASAKKNTARTAVRTSAVRKRTVRAVAKPKPKTRTASTSSVSDQQTAESVLRSLQAKYRYLDGVTVTIGKTPGNYQAVSYYARGRIVISPKHTASISTILKHEIWHCIDYRDNGKIDWGERVAPRNAADYLK